MKKKFLQKGAEQVDEGLPGWFGTFADMMTLLFAFFVLLFIVICLKFLYHLKFVMISSITSECK